MQKGNPKLLVGERDPFVRQQLEQILGPNFHLIFATDGLEVLSQAKIVRPDLIVLEVLLPSRDGLQVCRELKADPVTGSLPVLFYSVLRAEERVKQAGGDDFLLKPQPGEVLLSKINCLIKKAK